MKVLFSILTTLLALLFAGSVHAAPSNVAYCQVQMLKNASQVVEANFGTHASHVLFFNQITFNYSDADRPKVVYFGESNSGPQRYCLVQVLFEMPDMSHTNCNSLRITGIDTTCP